MGFIQKHLFFPWQKQKNFSKKRQEECSRDSADSVLPIAQEFFERHNRCWINKQQNELYDQQLSSVTLQHDRLQVPYLCITWIKPETQVEKNILKSTTNSKEQN